MKHNKTIFSAILLMIFLSIWLMVYTDNNCIKVIDSAINNLLIYFKTFEITKIMIAITQIGNTKTIIALFFITSLFLLFKRKIAETFILSFSVISTFFFTGMIKEITERHRPDISTWLYPANGWSFPSGHTSASFALFIVLNYINYKNIKNKTVRNLLSIIFITVPLLVGISRIYLNVHWFSDVISGIILASIMILLSFIFLEKCNSNLKFKLPCKKICDNITILR